MNRVSYRLGYPPPKKFDNHDAITASTATIGNIIIAESDVSCPQNFIKIHKTLAGSPTRACRPEREAQGSGRKPIYGFIQ